MTNLDMGQMVLFKGEALIVQSSSRVIFFKQTVDLDTKETSWEQYFELKIRGFLYYTKGNIRIQLTTDDYVYFYHINHETLMPELENCMSNYMGCN